MATAKQKKAARKNIKAAQKAWKEMSSRARARAQPEGNRAKPGTSGSGDYYHIEVRPRSQFKTFRTHDIGDPGGIQRVAGKRSSGSWATQKWLVAKSHAHVEGGRLVADSKEARKVLRNLGSEVKHLRADRFKAKPRPDIPERKKPTEAQKKARRQNIRKAQAAAHG
jgi:hypothetical protein